MAVQEPGVGLGPDQHGGVPAGRGAREECARLLVMLVAPIERRDEDSRVQKDSRVLQGDSRP